MFTMTKNVVSNLLRKSSTRLYPMEVRGNFEGFRGTLENRIEDCIFCGMCQRKCPSQCISVDMKAGTWECDPYACVYCGVCVDHCPVKCLSMSKEHRKATAQKEMIHLQGTPKAKKKPVAPAPAGASEPKADSGE